MTAVLDILSFGAVTSVGLDALQTAAACRARIAGFEAAIPLTPPQEPLRAARVPARAPLRRTATDWLVNLAARAIRESLGYRSVEGRIGLVITLPETARRHAVRANLPDEELLRRIAAAGGRQFGHAAIAGEGGAGIAIALRVATDLLQRGDVDACVVGGVDSLVNAQDVSRLRQAARMLEPDNPQGLIPGEGAGFVLVSLPGRFRGAVARIVSVAAAVEPDDVLGARFSQGGAFLEALEAATAGHDVPESSVSFRVSTANGERYAAWEAMFFTSRFYRTRREHLPVWYPASSVGELGAASGGVALVLAAIGIAGGYAPGPYAMCEAASETGLRGVCLVGPANGAPAPPFRPDEGASLHVISTLQP